MSEAVERRLAAIMFTDIVGYTSLTQRNEALSIDILDQHRRVVRPILSKHNGHEIKTIGDAFLVEFVSSVAAVECAAEIQTAMKEANAREPEERRVLIRIGIHLGDVIHRGNDVVGDAVNIASRIENLAPPGGICISSQVQASILNKVAYGYRTLGTPKLKNVATPIEVFQLTGLGEDSGSPTVRAGLQTKERIAVLPFVNMSPDPNDEYFADGMTEELIDRLAQVRQLRVIARTSAMTYKGEKEKRASQIARELDVNALVEGSVRKAGNRVRVTVQLISAETEEHIWSARYDGNLDDVFAVQSQIAEKVAGELSVQLKESERRSLESKPTKNMEAYGDFLRGRELLREGSEPSLRRALKLFQTAVELDSSFARAHVGVAESHQRLSNVGYELREVSLPAVKISLKRALELDPDLAEAHASLAELRINEDDLLGAEAEARRAIELNPSLPEPYRMLFEAAGTKGDPDEMVRNIETAYHLDPIRPNYIYLVGQAYLESGRERQALEHWRKTERLAPGPTYRSMTEYSLLMGDIAKARELHAKFEKLQPTHPWVTYMGGFIEALAGEREKALEAVRKIDDANWGSVSYAYKAYIYSALGDMDGYFENMDRALEEHTIVPTIVMYSPLLAKAREDQRYQELVDKLRRQVGLA